MSDAKQTQACCPGNLSVRTTSWRTSFWRPGLVVQTSLASSVLFSSYDVKTFFKIGFLVRRESPAAPGHISEAFIWDRSTIY